MATNKTSTATILGSTEKLSGIWMGVLQFTGTVGTGDYIYLPDIVQGVNSPIFAEVRAGSGVASLFTAPPVPLACSVVGTKITIQPTSLEFGTGAGIESTMFVVAKTI